MALDALNEPQLSLLWTWSALLEAVGEQLNIFVTIGVSSPIVTL